MREIIISRTWITSKATIGPMMIDGVLFCYVLELPWNENKRAASCIPPGEYICRWQRSPKYGWCYEVTNVPNRSRILIHNGNVAKHTKGCLLLGRTRGILKGQPAVLTSKPTLRKFHNFMDRQPFKLIIQENRDA